MSRLIDADALLEKMSCHCDICNYDRCKPPKWCRGCDWREAMNDVDDMDEIEATPVQHGHWEYISNYEIELCSNCKCFSPLKFNYCPYCGTKMDK